MSSDEELDEAFDKLKSEGQNTVDGIVQWMKRAKLVRDELTERLATNILAKKDELADKLKGGFSETKAELSERIDHVIVDTKAQTQIEVEKFKEVVQTVQTKSVDDIKNKLLEEGEKETSRFVTAAKDAYVAFKNSLKKSKEKQND